ncbi:uncharacterized protein Dvir_GJ26660 [Drosophila virilis]|uniref:DNA recombination and repair protein Rad51-like C-terminal domain-containing protein n=1 Tax=Drosophila virilis TaxID=7244 RepID=A0A0Q9WXJ5_DROVI|nr:uncharacterized protein LOC26531430 [Drosophila virilis]KRF85742.1 uncharacterized protein Dvir_GJ26660 [Drosophila virilis]
MDIISAANLYLRQIGELRPSISDLKPSIFTTGGPEPRSLVEISGKRRSGKTLLLMQLVANCLTRCDVILININHKIDLQLLGKLLQDAVKNANPQATAVELQEICEKCMDSLEIINCFSSLDVRLAIKALDHHILLDNERVSLVAIDGLCEFYWFDLPPNVPMRKYTYYMKFLERIHRISKRFYVCCMYTVDSSYLKTSYAPSRAINIDHKLQLNCFRGKRTLNNKRIVINESGIQVMD